MRERRPSITKLIRLGRNGEPWYNIGRTFFIRASSAKECWHQHSSVADRAAREKAQQVREAKFFAASIAYHKENLTERGVRLSTRPEPFIGAVFSDDLRAVANHGSPGTMRSISLPDRVSLTGCSATGTLPG